MTGATERAVRSVAAGAGPSGAARLKAAYFLAGAAGWAGLYSRSGRGKLLERLLAPHLNGLSVSAGAIGGYMKQLDRRFEGFGEDMSELSMVSRSLVDQCTSLLELSVGTGETQALARDALGLLEEPLRFLTGQAESMVVQQRELEECRALIDEVLCAGARLSEAVAPLRYIRTMFLTESARLDESIQAMFNALTEQMRGLQERVESAFESNYSSLRETQQTRLRVSETLRARSKLLSEGGAASGLNVARSRETLIESLSRNEGKTVELTEVARGIEAYVHTMVVSMQVHDIVNQKLDHVRAALGGLRELASRMRGSDGRQTALLLVTLNRMAGIQEAQLEGAAEELRHSAVNFGAACSQVVVKVEDLDQRCLQLREFDEITASADGMIEVLVHSIGEVRRLAAEEREVISGVLERVKGMGEQAAPLGQGMVEVAEQMRRIAVNTQVYAIQMGNGTGLEALSAESVQVAARVAGVSSDVVAALGRLNALLVELSSALEERQRTAAGIEAAMSSRGSELEAALHATRDRMLALLLEVGDSMGRARAIGSRVQGHVHAEELFSGGMAQAMQSVRSFASMCGWLIEQLGLSDVEPDAALLTDRYTMQSERRIHAQAGDRKGPAGEAAAGLERGREAGQGAATVTAASDDLGDNIELF